MVNLNRFTLGCSIYLISTIGKPLAFLLTRRNSIKLRLKQLPGAQRWRKWGSVWYTRKTSKIPIKLMHMTAATAVEEDSLLMTLYLMEEGDQTIHLGSHYIGHDLSSQGLKMELFFFVCCTCNTLSYFIYLAKHMKCSVKLLLIYKCICNCCFSRFGSAFMKFQHQQQKENSSI